MLLSLRALASAGALLLSSCGAAAAAVDIMSAQAPMLPRQDAVNASGSGEWPYGPWSTDGRDVKNSRGQAVTPVGFNWPGSGETMVPEGLRYVAASTFVKRLADLGFNFARHTYAIEMIDMIYENNGTDISLERAFLNGLGSNGTRVLQEILDKNADMGWTKDTTRLEVWDSIAKLEAEHGILMHPDVHVSKAKWCCSNDDGNAWFDDLYFDTAKWRRGLSYMANWAKNHTNIVSMSLHNELREATGRPEAEYTWLTWAGNMTAGADAIHEANPDLLITFSGLQYDQDLSAVVQEANLNTATAYKLDPVRDGHRREPVYFKIDDHKWANKAVLELHLYDQSADADTGSCEAIQAQLYYYGFSALGMDPPSGCLKEGETDHTKYNCPAPARKTPVWMTEFGQAQDSTLNNATLANCLREFTIDHKIGWAVWSIAGSYYTRQGTQDLDDTWALLNHEWTDWRDPDTIESYWKPYIAAMGTTNIEKNSTSQA